MLAFPCMTIFECGKRHVITLAEEVPMTTSTAPSPTRGRWWIVVAAVLVQLALGAVYAWSVFNKPLQAEFGWSKTEAVLPFEVAIGTIFIGSLIGGRIQGPYGARAGGLGGGGPYFLGDPLASPGPLPR